MGVIEFVKDVGRRLGVGDTPPAQSAQAPATPPGPEALPLARSRWSPSAWAMVAGANVGSEIEASATNHMAKAGKRPDG